MWRYRLFYALWYVVNALTVIFTLGLLWGLAWEHSVRHYLQGFADAIVDPSVSPEQKVEALLAWMRSPRVPEGSPYQGFLENRDPVHTLNSRRLLAICGSAVNAFVNLAMSAGLECRRLLLLNEKDEAKHVVAEVRLNGRWVVVDPALRALLRDRQGRLLTKEELRDPRILQEVTRTMVGYDPRWTYERTAHVRMERIPYLGRFLRRVLNRVFPKWEERTANWTLILERASTLWIVFAMALLCFSLVARTALRWYGERRLGITCVRLRKRLLRACQALLEIPATTDH